MLLRDLRRGAAARLDGCPLSDVRHCRPPALLPLAVEAFERPWVAVGFRCRTPAADLADDVLPEHGGAASSHTGDDGLRGRLAGRGPCRGGPRALPAALCNGRAIARQPAGVPPAGRRILHLARCRGRGGFRERALAPLRG